MKVTATVNVKNQSFAGVQNHVEHDRKINHQNQNIDFEKTQFNQTEVLLTPNEIHDLKQERYQNDFEKYNQSQKKSRHISKMFASVDDYVKAKEKTNSFDKTAVATFGNKADQDNLLKDHSLKEQAAILTAQSKGLAAYAKTFNQRNEFMQLGRYTTNVDESTPHVHMQLIPLGYTAKGKPSMSFNAALTAEYEAKTGKKIKDTRKALSWFREQEDQSLVTEIEQQLTQKYELTRTQEHIADFDSYKKIKLKLAEKEQNIQAQTNQVKQDQKIMGSYQTEVTEFIREINPTHKVEPDNPDYHEVKTQEGFAEHIQAPIKNLFQGALDVIKQKFRKEQQRIEKFQQKMKNFAQKFYQKHTNFNEKSREILSDFQNDTVYVKNKDGQSEPHDKLDYLLDTFEKQSEKLEQKETRLTQRESELDQLETSLKKRNEELDGYKEKLVAKEIANGNFQQAKETNQIEKQQLKQRERQSQKPRDLGRGL